MLSGGIPPFNGKEESEIIAKVRAGKWSRQALEDVSVSKEAIDFIDKCLQLDPSKRMTAADALNHQWISNKKEDE